MRGSIFADVAGFFWQICKNLSSRNLSYLFVKINPNEIFVEVFFSTDLVFKRTGDPFTATKIRIKWPLRGIWWESQVVGVMANVSLIRETLFLKKLEAGCFWNEYKWLQSSYKLINHMLPQKLSVVDMNSEVSKIQGINVSESILLATNKKTWKLSNKVGKNSLKEMKVNFSTFLFQRNP